MEGMIKLSRHASRDRVERLSRIVMEVRLGHSVFEGVSDDRACTITSTGVLLIWDYEPQGKVLLTAYLVTIDKAMAIYRKKGCEHIPNGLYNTIIKNKRIHKELYHI